MKAVRFKIVKNKFVVYQNNLSLISEFKMERVSQHEKSTLLKVALTTNF